MGSQPFTPPEDAAGESSSDLRGTDPSEAECFIRSKEEYINVDGEFKVMVTRSEGNNVRKGNNKAKL